MMHCDLPSPPCALPVGATVLESGGVRFHVWAPAAKHVAVRMAGKTFPLHARHDGYHEGVLAQAHAGLRYKFVLPRGEFPDPASRFQPEGPHGPSLIVDPHTFRWADHCWRGVSHDNHVIYEMHIGTFTREGTWAAATEHLNALAELGVTLIEVMPVADFPGRFGWGYDGVSLFAPTRLYGEPDDFRRFVDRAHALGLGVILDVVYNHLGPDGNYLREFSPHYFTKRHHTEWGDAINFDGEHAGPVREFIVANAGYWITEFHLDGLRLDATHRIFDTSPVHILTAIARHVRETASGCGTFVVAENEAQVAQLARPVKAGGCGLDALWNDDFHHVAAVALTGRRDAYLASFRGAPHEFISLAKHGYIFQGEGHQRRRCTPPFDLRPSQFVNCLQNHDQIANTLGGQRTHQLASAAKTRAITALLLLGPWTPMLFQGQEFAASAPFYYFADHQEELATAIARSREKLLSRFPSLTPTPETRTFLTHPELEETFLRCKLEHAERARNEPVLALHRDLIALRRTFGFVALDGAVLGESAFMLRFFGVADDDRLLVVNLGPALHLTPTPEPLLAPVSDEPWRLAWSSEAPQYGGAGTSPLDTGNGWELPADSAALFAS